jgi:hypothetical protein
MWALALRGDLSFLPVPCWRFANFRVRVFNVAPGKAHPRADMFLREWPLPRHPKPVTLKVEDKNDVGGNPWAYTRAAMLHLMIHVQLGLCLSPPLGHDTRGPNGPPFRGNFAVVALDLATPPSASGSGGRIRPRDFGTSDS